MVGFSFLLLLEGGRSSGLLLHGGGGGFRFAGQKMGGALRV